MWGLKPVCEKTEEESHTANLKKGMDANSGMAVDIDDVIRYGVMEQRTTTTHDDI